MIQRHTQQTLRNLLAKNPVVALTGPRQVGKTTLALEIAAGCASVYLDLERPSDLAKLHDIEQFCSLHADRLLIFDEIQRIPELFAPLRSIIDDRKRQGRRLVKTPKTYLRYRCQDKLTGFDGIFFGADITMKAE